eukprot:4225898-Pleurochrysis_carterae.AAC.2
MYLAGRCWRIAGRAPCAGVAGTRSLAAGRRRGLPALMTAHRRSTGARTRANMGYHRRAKGRRFCSILRATASSELAQMQRSANSSEMS